MVVLPVAMLVLALAAPMTARGAVLEGVEVLGDRGQAVRLELSAPVVPFARTLAAAGDAPDRVYVDLPGTMLAPGLPRSAAGRGRVVRVRTGQFDLETARVVIDLAGATSFRMVPAGRSLTVELIGRSTEPGSIPRLDPPAADDPPPTVTHVVPVAPAPPPSAPRASAPPRRPAPPRLAGSSPRPGTGALTILSADALPPLPDARPRSRPATRILLSLSAEATPPLPARLHEPAPGVVLMRLSDAALPLLPVLPEPPPPPAPVALALAEPCLPRPVDPARAPRAGPRTAARPEVPAPAPSPMALSDAVVILDAGHGGRDPGAEGVGGILEKDIVLEVTRVVAERLLARLPVSVVLTRADDSFVPLERRLALPGEGATLFISLHANACDSPSARGLEVFYGGGGVRTASTGSGNAQAARLGRALGHALDARIGGLRGEARPGEFTVLVRNPVPSALVEIGYLTHPEEASNARDPAHQQRLADAIVDGVAEYLRTARPPL